MVFVYGVVIFVNLQLLCLLCLIGFSCANVVILVVDTPMVIANGSCWVVLGSSAIDGSSYVMVSAAKCARTCVSGNGPICGE